jgi:iron complex transport system substrate-binding protein
LTLIRIALALIASLTLAAQTPKRIVSTAPGITEILFALGLGDRVVGVTDYCRYPPEVKKLPKIGSWMTPNMEVILSLRPDLIVVQRTAVHDSSRFRAAKLRTLDVYLDRIPDIFSTIEAVGKTAGVPDRARALTAQIRAGLKDIQSRVSSRPRTSLLFSVGRNAGSLDGLIAVGPQSYLSEIIDLAGGRNVLADSPVPYAKVVQEEIVARNPEVIIDMGVHPDANGITPAQERSEIALWGKFPTVPAVRNHRVHIVASEIFVVPGPRVVECARQIARFLHPELFR